MKNDTDTKSMPVSIKYEYYKTTIYFGYLTLARQQSEKRLMDFLFNTQKTEFEEVIL